MDGRPRTRGVGGDDAGGRVTSGSSSVEPGSSLADTARATADDRGVERTAADGVASARGGSETGSGAGDRRGSPWDDSVEDAPMFGGSDGSVASAGSAPSADGRVGLPGPSARRGVGDRDAASGAKPRAGVDGPARSASSGGVGLDGGGRSGRGGSETIVGAPGVGSTSRGGSASRADGGGDLVARGAASDGNAIAVGKASVSTREV